MQSVRDRFDHVVLQKDDKSKIFTFHTPKKYDVEVVSKRGHHTPSLRCGKHMIEYYPFIYNVYNVVHNMAGKEQLTSRVYQKLK